ncbi:unnamed protein product [Paramecium pentaurelia]|uniref:Uncharacterized protein n=1 Tax=Paramecium pentaurelia TaxID=43138 RepID=A0A8S1UM96_9CILI|nr:unnamed protein product [Paramecium pentaurelia]
MKQNQQLELSKEKVPLFKFILIGDQSVGKSCIVERFQNEQFSYKTKATIGVEFIKKLVQVDKGLVEIQLWDTAGQEQFRSMIRGFYRGSAAVIIVYSVNQKESFDQLSIWMNEIEQHAHPEIIKVLVGNKCDLPREVEKQEAESFMNNNQFSLFFETSAKTGENVEEAFVQAAKLVLLKYLSSESFRQATRVNKKSADPINIIKSFNENQSYEGQSPSQQKNSNSSGCC